MMNTMINWSCYVWPSFWSWWSWWLPWWFHWFTYNRSCILWGKVRWVVPTIILRSKIRVVFVEDGHRIGKGEGPDLNERNYVRIMVAMIIMMIIIMVAMMMMIIIMVVMMMMMRIITMVMMILNLWHMRLRWKESWWASCTPTVTLYRTILYFFVIWSI